MVLCIMHIYAHILAAEDDEAGRAARVVQIARTVFMQMPAHSCCTLRHFPYRCSSPSKLTSLAVSLSISRFRGRREGRGEGEKRRESRWKTSRGEERREKMARQETRKSAHGLARFIFLASTIEYSSKSCAGRNGESARNGKESAGLNKTTLLNYLLGRGEQSRYRDASSTSSIYQ